MLPTTRDATIDGSSPIPSSLLNKLQDLFVGDKHVEREIPLSAPDWSPLPADTSTYEGSDWTVGSGGGAGTGTFFCNVPIPVGHRITQVSFAYPRGTAGTITMVLQKRTLLSGSPTDVATFVDSTHDGASVQHVISGINEVAVTGEAYYLKIAFSGCTGITSRFMGGSFYYDNL